MGSPIGFGDCVAMVEKALALYEKIRHEVPGIVADVCERVEDVKRYLRRVDQFIKHTKGLTGVRPQEVTDLSSILKKIRVDVEKVNTILVKWESNDAGFGIQWRFKFLHQALFALGSSPKELENLKDSLDQRLSDVNMWLQLLQAWGWAATLDPSDSSSLKAPPGSKSPLSKSPEPSIKRKDYRIIFLDKYGNGRSRTAEAYARLVKGWTKSTDETWRINRIHSAGIQIETKSQTAELQKKLRMPMGPGAKKPDQVAMKALFDYWASESDFKEEIRRDTVDRSVRGLTANLFNAYDYIFCFNRVDMASLENLKDALTRLNGQGPPSGKGRVVLLGDYGTNAQKEIWQPKTNADGTESSEEWTKAIKLIEKAFLKFLRTELAWRKPPPEKEKTGTSEASMEKVTT